ncbi:phage major tail tube protein [Rhizobium sp. CFBP 8762]|uniref:phage major tail tube protein n=1 Tax=Rhizobium sp. CFBP 8762 TaxID=2775279 RepID=UPI00178231A5|nr:phage major tail tube protein [Rhizobium sp. CFBP 8762]MBD8556913.1 phage major tail tube protein [Rhizobium sp. CFBP 8762]
MAEKLRYVLRNCTLWADRESKVGQVSEITLPVPQAKIEEVRNSGMAIPAQIVMGYEKLEFSFKMTGFDPQILKLFGLKIGSETPFMITGSLVDEDGTSRNATATIRGILKQADAGSWKSGEMAETDYQVSVNYYKLEVEGEELIEMDAFDIKIGGVSQYGDVRRDLLL